MQASVRQTAQNWACETDAVYLVPFANIRRSGGTNEIKIAPISSLQDGRIWYLAGIALVAQLVEHLICNQGVAGSNPAGGTIS